MTKDKARAIRKADLRTPTGLAEEATRDIAGALTALLADVFALYLKTKNFHWHMSGPHFRDYHLLLDDQGDQLIAVTDPLAERVRRSAARRCGRSAISGGCSVSLTTTPISSRRRTCWPNFAMTIAC